MNRTTIILKGKSFPLFETKRGAYDFEMNGFKMKNIADSRVSDLQAYVFFCAKNCAKLEGINFPYRDLDAFVDDEDVDIESIGKAFIKMRKREDADIKSIENTPTTEGEAKPEA